MTKADQIIPEEIKALPQELQDSITNAIGQFSMKVMVDGVDGLTYGYMAKMLLAFYNKGLEDAKKG